MSKIFGDFENANDLNECAVNLRDNNEIDDLKVLAMENEINLNVIEKFIKGDIQALIDTDEVTSSENAQSTQSSEDTTAPKEESVTAKPNEPPIPPNETPTERINREVKDAKNKHVPTVPIAKRLITLIETDTALGDQILLPHKSLEKCFKYVEEQASKKCTSGRGWIDDDEVYQMAVDYYNLDDAEAERKKEEEHKKREEENKKRAEESKKRAAERAKAGKGNPSTSTKPPTVKNAPVSEQLTLWG